jgi:alpha-L-fucosidase
LTLTLEAQGNGVKASAEGTAADGSRTAWSYTANYDGKDNPITGVGTNGADTAARKRINANTTEGTYKKAGKVVSTLRGVVSKDGKVLTITGKGTNAQGQPVSTVTVWDKQ